jgi:hypothetical protein
MGLRRLRSRLDGLEDEANTTMAMAQALIAEAGDGFRVTAKVRFTGPILKFLGQLFCAALTRKEPDWAKAYPDGLPIEIDAQVHLNED